MINLKIICVFNNENNWKRRKNMSEKKGFLDRISELTYRLAEPLGKFSELPSISAIQNGLVGVMPVIIVGSVFLVLYVLGSGSVGNGEPLLPFLAPIAVKFVFVNSYTLGFLSLYTSISIAMNYGEKIGINPKTCGILGLVTFILITQTGGTIDTTAFSASGLFVTIVVVLMAVRIFKVIVDRNIVIKLPDSVPPNIGNAFTAIIPYAVVMTFAWIVRTILEIDLVLLFSTILTPFISAADNVFVYGVNRLLHGLLWGVGLHGDNMLNAVFAPFVQSWTAENAAAVASGVPLNQLPHIWTSNGIDRISTWTATVWPLIFYMIFSKVDWHKPLGFACLPSSVFTIVEPVIFGLPLALNPFLIIPFIITNVVNGVVVYSIYATGWLNRFYAELPWATPPFILGPMGTQDLKSLFVVIISFLIGIIIYYPFWKQYEKDCLKKEAEKLSVQ